MKKSAFALVALLSAAGLAQTPKWAPWTPKEGGIQVALPGKPARSEMPVGREDQKGRMVRYVVETQTQFFVVGFRGITPSISKELKPDRIPKFLRMMNDDVARSLDSTKTSEKTYQIGKRMVLSNQLDLGAGGTARVDSFIHAGRVWSLLMVEPVPDPKTAGRFFGSIVLK